MNALNGLVRPREDWQSGSQPVSGPSPVAPGTWVIHYPGSPSSYEPSNDDELAAYLRQIQNDYLKSRGYSIGYNWSVGQHGGAYETRGRDFRNAANAGQKVEGNFNSESESIFVAVGAQNAATQAAVEKINAIIATQPSWGVRVHMDVDYTSCAGAGVTAQVRDGIIGHGAVVPPQPPPNVPDGYAPPHEWGLFPLDSNKPPVQNGTTSEHVMYLNDVLYFYASGSAARGATFTSQTEAAVRNLQRMFGLTVDGKVGPAETWPVVDYIVWLNKPVEVTPPPANSDGVVGVMPCKYMVQSGDSPWGVGEKVYGSGRLGATLLDPSLFSAYSTPGNPIYIDIPESKGMRTVVQSGDGAMEIVRRFDGGSTDRLGTFYDWNGGWEWVYHPGDVVYMPEA